MGRSQTNIEINGKVYDALTGRLLGDRSAPSTHTRPISSGHTLEGVTNKGVKLTAKPARRHTHLPAPQAHAHKQQKPKTLMRHALKNPLHQTSARQRPMPNFSVQTPVDGLGAETGRSSDPVFIGKMAPERITRAMSIHKSKLVSRFGDVRGTLHKKIAPLPVRPEPSPAGPRQSPKTARSAPSPKPHQPLKANPVHEAMRQAHSPKAKISLKREKVRHKIARKLGVSRRVASTTAVALAVLLGVGFFAYQNLSNITMRLAAARAHIDAKMPGYLPSGFSIQGPIKYKPGQVTVSFKSNSDSRSFDVTQSTSSWNSEALLENFVATTNKPYQTYQENGLTIFVYDGSNATWVNDNIWHRIEGNSSLSVDQLIQLATSH